MSREGLAVPAPAPTQPVLASGGTRESPGPRSRHSGASAQPLGSLDQILATLLYLGNPLRQETTRPLADPILGGPQPVDLALAEKIRALAGPVGASVLPDYGPYRSKS